MKALLLSLLVLCACSPQKRLQKLLDKHPEFTRSDTITVRDTVTIAGDTAFRMVPVHVFDTVRIDTGRLHVRVIRLPGDTLFITAACDPDTIYTEKKVVVERIVPCPPGYKGRVAGWWRIVALVLAGVVALLVWMRRR